VRTNGCWTSCRLFPPSWTSGPDSGFGTLKAAHCLTLVLLLYEAVSRDGRVSLEDLGIDVA
jgi:hypothetical protein